MDAIFSDLLEQVVMIVAGLLFSALSAFGTYYINKLIAYLKEKQALETVGRFVRWAEQAPAFQDWSGEQKFEIVFSKAMQWFSDNGIDLPEDEVAIMVEDAVKKMKEAATPLYEGKE
jgi:hypothetical protein